MLSEVVTDAFQDLVKTSDFSELKAIVGELALAQYRTGINVDKLTQAVAQLTRQGLSQRRQVGGLSDQVGGGLEDTAQFMVIQVLQNELGWKVHSLERSWQP